MRAKLKDYQAEHSHCRVPYKHPADPKLGRWVTTQREYKKKLDAGHPHPWITEERVRRCLCLMLPPMAKTLPLPCVFPLPPHLRHYLRLVCFHCLRG